MTTNENGWHQNANGNYVKTIGKTHFTVYQLKDDYGTKNGEWSYCKSFRNDMEFVDVETTDVEGLLEALDEPNCTWFVEDDKSIRIISS